MAEEHTNNISRSGAVSPSAEKSRRKTIDRRDRDSTELIRPPSEERRKSPRRRPPSMKQDAKDNTDDDKQPKDARDASAQLNETEQLIARCRRLLVTCEPVARVNYQTLSMDNYPSNEFLDHCRKVRDYWMLGAMGLLFLFFLGLIGLLPGWIAGLGLGLSLMCVIFGVTPIRHYVSRTPLLSEVIQQRRRLEKDAISHIAYLEGGQNLAFRCAALVEYNPGLNKPAFASLINASRNGSLLSILRTKKHIRLYLLFMLESQKAFTRLERFYQQLRKASLDEMPQDPPQKEAKS